MLGRSLLMKAGGAAITGDPFFSSVLLLLRGDGANGSTNIVDSSPSPKTVTAFNGAEISTAQSKYGGSSIAFNTAGAYLRTQIINLMSGFTIETWAYVNNTNAGVRAICGNWNNEQLLFAQNGSSLEFYWFPFNASEPLVSASGLIAQQWQHLAVTRQGSVFRLFIDGTLVASETNNSAGFSSTAAFLVGAYPHPGGYPVMGYSGHLDDFRLTGNNIARYTANFTPPPAPFPDF